MLPLGRRGAQLHDKIRSDGFEEFKWNMGRVDDNYKGVSIFTVGGKNNNKIVY